MKHNLKPKYKASRRNLHFLGLELKRKGKRVSISEGAMMYQAGEKWAKEKLKQIRYEIKTTSDPKFVEMECALDGEEGTTNPSTKL